MELDVFSLKLLVPIWISVPVFYLVGAVIVKGLKNPILSIGIRVAIGLLAVTSFLAVTKAALGTGLIFYFLLFIALAIRNRGRVDFSDLKSIGLKYVALILLLTLAVLVFEANRASVISGDDVYIGNADASFYSSVAHSLYDTGVETFPENVSPETKSQLYHFGDLWLSGIYSWHFSILPYYAYLIGYRVVSIVCIGLMLFGWISQVSKKTVLALFGAFLVFTSAYLELIPLSLPDYSIFDLFMCYWPLYGASPYLIIAVAAIAFSALITENNVLFGGIGLMFIPFLNAGLTLTTAAAAIILVAGYLTFKFFVKKVELPKVSTFLLFVTAGLMPLIYYKLDGRLDSPTADIFSLDFIYVFIHTVVRVGLSQVFVIPYLIGLIYFLKGTKGQKLLFAVSMAFYVGSILALAFVFPQVYGNSTQILSIHFSGILVPVCVVGLFGLSLNSSGKLIRTLAILSLAVITYQSFRISYNTQWYLQVVDWDSYIEKYKESHSFSLLEWEQIRGLLNKKSNRVGYFICDSTASGGVRYNEFTYLKGVFPGTVFYRLNPLSSDTIRSIEELGYYKRSGLGYFADKHSFNETLTTNAYMDFLQLDFLMSPKENPKYCVPESRIDKHSEKTNTENFEFYGKKGDETEK